jgi:tetratricopeptide (TPR) repeat protein
MAESEDKVARSSDRSTEIESIQPTLSEEDKRTRLDFVLAICICIAAAIFWFWDSIPAANTTASQPTPRPSFLGSNLADGFNNQGAQLYRAGDYAGAETLFRKAIAADPEGALGYCNLGAALIPQQKYDEAIAALQRSIALDPSSTLTRNNLRWALDAKAKHQQ